MSDRIAGDTPAANWQPDRSWFSRDAREVAPQLLGAHIESRVLGSRVTIRITEAEAYCGTMDPGSHAYRGWTKRTATMFGPAGHLYVYFTYGMHWCINVVCGAEGEASAVLLRAGEVVDGLEVARARRPAARKDVDLARGPARLASALAVAGESNGADLFETSAPIRITFPQQVSGAIPNKEISTGPRVGVSGPGGDGDTYPWRYWLTGDPTVSQYRPGGRKRR